MILFETALLPPEQNKIPKATFAAYETVFDEIESIFDQIIKTLSYSKKENIAVFLQNKQMPHFSMLLDKLDDAKINYTDTVGRIESAKFYETVIDVWADWQIKRDIGGLCRFCAELLSNDLLSSAQFETIINDCARLQNQCLSDNYDLVLEFANLKNIHSFDVIEKYDMHGEKHVLNRFLKSFIAAFSDILPAEIVKNLKINLNNKDENEIFLKEFLIKHIISSIRNDNKRFSFHENACVVLTTDVLNLAKHSHVFIVSATAKYFDNSENNRMFSSLLEPKLAESCQLHLSYSKKLFSENIVKQEPAQIFSDLFYSLHGKFYSKKEEENLLTLPICEPDFIKHDTLTNEDRNEINMCAESYLARHDLSQKENDYCFAIDKKFNVRLSCKSFEFLLKNPNVGFYDTVLKLPTMPWKTKSFDKKIAIGSFVHDFLQIFEAKDGFIKKPQLNLFFNNIKARAERIKTLMSKACAASDLDSPTDFFRTVDTAVILAKRLANGLFSIKNWESFCSEYSIPQTLSVKLGEEKIELSGRIDFLISKQDISHAKGHPSEVTIIDFKTGSDFELTERNVKYLLQKYSSLQLFLYGIAMKNLGFDDVKILLLKPDRNESIPEISLDYIFAKAPELIENLAQTIKTGLIKKQTLGKAFRKYFVDRVPLATTDLY